MLNFWDTHQEATLDSGIDCECGKFISMLDEIGEYGIFQKGEYGPDDVHHDKDGNVLDGDGHVVKYHTRVLTRGPRKGEEICEPDDPDADIPCGGRMVWTIKKHPTMGYNARKFKHWLRYPDKLLWVIHKEYDNTMWLHRPVLLDVTPGGCEKQYSLGPKAYDCTGLSHEQILACCFADSEFNARDFKKEGLRLRKTIPVQAVGWSIEYDGYPIMELIRKKPKMTFAEIRNVIENEGGSIDASGIIHRA